jgi:hypothetical protein
MRIAINAATQSYYYFRVLMDDSEYKWLAQGFGNFVTPFLEISGEVGTGLRFWFGESGIKLKRVRQGRFHEAFVPTGRIKAVKSYRPLVEVPRQLAKEGKRPSIVLPALPNFAEGAEITLSTRRRNYLLRTRGEVSDYLGHHAETVNRGEPSSLTPPVSLDEIVDNLTRATPPAAEPRHEPGGVALLERPRPMVSNGAEQEYSDDAIRQMVGLLNDALDRADPNIRLRIDDQGRIVVRKYRVVEEEL